MIIGPHEPTTEELIDVFRDLDPSQLHDYVHDEADERQAYWDEVADLRRQRDQLNNQGE